MNDIDHLPEVRRLRSLKWGSHRIGAELGIGKHTALRLLKVLELEDAKSSSTKPVAEIEPRTVAEYAERIAACWHRSREAFIEAGRLLCAAKAALDHGEFQSMVETQLPFKLRKAEMLMAVHRDQRLVNPRICTILPNELRTLYDITRLDDDGLQRRISDGTIKPDMERSAIAGIVKAERRANREATLGGMQAAANLKLPSKRYGVILADPPWRFEPYSRETGMDRAADNHYPTSSIKEICDLNIRDIAARDCVLLLWATAPILPGALQVMEAWGFTYKSHCIWRKDRAGTGFWFQSIHELFLVGTCGSEIPAPASGMCGLSVFDEPIGEHSVKPKWAYDFIERWYPNLPKVELFARRARAGWDRWGLDAPTQTEAAE